MKRVLYILCAIHSLACSNPQQQNKVLETSIVDSPGADSEIMFAEKIKTVEFDSISCGLNFMPGKNYKFEKNEIKNQRDSLCRIYLKLSEIEQNSLLDSSGVIFTNFLLNNIIPYWYGTEWDFNGYTSTPNEGVIACGYFVSTTLRDMGLDLNRYKQAQQGPENEAKSISIETSDVLCFEKENRHDALQELEQGIYFIGLDNHVGYLYKKSSQAYFIHSNYIDGRVMIENTEYSEAFNSYNYNISKITGNKTLMKKWLKKEEIKVLTE